jgi:hypothetical protein
MAACSPRQLSPFSDPQYTFQAAMLLAEEIRHGYERLKKLL